MKESLGRSALILLLLFPAVCLAEDYPLGRGAPGFAVSAGGSLLRIGTGWDVAPALGMRYYLALDDALGPEALSPWSIEAGVLLPHAVPQRLTDVIKTTGHQPLKGYLKRMQGAHLAGQFKWAMRWPVRMHPDVSLGVQVARFENEFLGAGSTGFYKRKEKRTAVAPLGRLGLSLLANDIVAFRIEAGYVWLPNKTAVEGVPFDFSVSGLAIYPSIQVSLGYLTPGVSKGVYLPRESLPLWVLSAMQTEKRSPIIAPPEVYLNSAGGPAAQASASGLSGNVLFQYKRRRAQKVELIADFNQWTPEPMVMDQNHVWVTVKDLPAGTYRYKFLINGKREVRDPWNIAWEPSHRPGGSSTFFIPEVFRHE